MHRIDERETKVWAEAILEAALDRRDPQPYIAAAIDTGIDVEVLQRIVNAILDAVARQLGVDATIAWPEPVPSVEDLADLKDLGIDGA